MVWLKLRYDSLKVGIAGFVEAGLVTSANQATQQTSLFKFSRKPISLGILLVNRQDKLKVGFSYWTTGTATSPLTTDDNRAGSYVRMWSRYFVYHLY
jgi:hypothetical protein